MRIGAGAVRWDWLALATLLVILVPLAAGLVPDDVWMAACAEPLGDSDDPGTAACSGAAGASVVVVAASLDFRLPAAADPVVAGWIGLTPTDRGPPRV